MNSLLVRSHFLRFSVVLLVPVLSILFTQLADARDVSLTEHGKPYDSVLEKNFLVTWYGNPWTSSMGVLGKYKGAELATGLRQQANKYAELTSKRITAAYQIIAVVCQDNPGVDGKWRRRETKEVIDGMLEDARAHGFKLILDVQVGHSTVQDELAYLRPWLEEPDVYLALDPEFDMWKGQTPGIELGHTTADEVNYAIAFLEEIITQNSLPPKVLIVHQFTRNMLPDKENIGSSPVLDVLVDMDGFGAPPIKLDTFKMVTSQPLEFVGVKLFYQHDPDLLTPRQVMQLDPQPSMVIYQ